MPLPLGGCVIIDSTECPIQRPVDSEDQRMFYSGYKKVHTLKYEVAIDEEAGLPAWVSGPFPGPSADITIFWGGLKQALAAVGSIGIADGTYQGEPAALIVPPRPYRDLTPERRAYHRFLSERRVNVENFFGRQKTIFTCLSVKWRHAIEKHGIIFHVTAQILSVEFFFSPLRQ